MTSRIDLVIDGPVARITLANPDAGNAIDQAFADRLLDIVHVCEMDSSIRAVLLTGSGRFFCVGGDINAFATASADLGNFVRRLTASLHVAMARLARLSKPVVVAVNGPVAGAGLGLALSGDVVIAGKSASFALAYPAIGLSPDAGTTFMLPRLIGYRRAQEMLMMGRALDSAEAAAWGLVTMTTSNELLAGHAEAAALKLAAMPTRALARSKRLLIDSYGSTIEAQLEREAEAIALCAVEDHANEGISAFLERRVAKFS